MVLKSAPDGAEGHVVHLCARVDDVEVLASSLSYNARISAIRVKVVANLLPQRVEGSCAAREMQARQRRIIQCRLDVFWGAG